MSADSSVKVGVRVRPLLEKERNQALSIAEDSCTDQCIIFKSTNLTFDHVFGASVSQQRLYGLTAAPMLKSFLEGFNVTIMAYGQTGSGKTYTMGTNNSDQENGDDQGLIPRFIFDLFDNLTESCDSEKRSFKVSVSFIEIYGEDVYDLLNGGGGAGSRVAGAERTSLQIRENEQGHVFVQGLHESNAVAAQDALELLDFGSKQRITASTAMNAGSSRSHAVFTVSLQQNIISTSTEGDISEQIISSKLTFVDLAGSERIKRTGAEGQRMKEGIQINSGLFNLGQVINGLADDQRLQKGGPKQFIPYRNSKLTHLLKDALGGNSQTLFLACVSPAESNESETHSTLIYAKQARNIKNKPIKNTDKIQEEKQRLKMAVKVWMTKAVSHIFGNRLQTDQNLKESSIDFTATPIKDPSQSLSLIFSPENNESTDLFGLPEVRAFVDSVNQSIDAKMKSGESTNRKIRLSTSGRPSYRGGGHKATLLSPPLGGLRTKSVCDFYSPAGVSATPGEGLDTSRVFDPVETEKLVQRMMDMINMEKDNLSQEQIKERDEHEIKQIDIQIQEKEEILSKLVFTVKEFASMKAEYERLLEEIGHLEKERNDLEVELEKAKKMPESGVTSVAVEKMKDRFLKVKDELDQMKTERKTKENTYKLMQRESKQVEALQKELNKLKEGRAQALKVQKSQAIEFQKLKKEHQVKLENLKKSEAKKKKELETVSSELVKKNRVLGLKDKEISRIMSKLKTCEDHISKLHKIQSRNRTNKAGSPSKHNGLIGGDLEHLLTVKNMLDNMVKEQVEFKMMTNSYEQKSKFLHELNQELAEEASKMQVLLTRQMDLSCSELCEEIGDGDQSDRNVEEEKALLATEISKTEHNIDRISREIELSNTDLEDLSRRLDSTSKSGSGTFSNVGRDVISSCSALQCHPLLYDILCEKSDVLEALYLTEEDLKASQAQIEEQRKRIKILEDELNRSSTDFRKRIEDVERQRVNDLWTLVKSNNIDESSQSRSMLAENCYDISREVILARAKDLEEEIDNLIQRDDARSKELSQIRDEKKGLEEELLELKFSKKSDLSSSEFSSSKCEYFVALNELWRKMGLSSDQKKIVIDGIVQAEYLAKENAVHEAERNFEDSMRKADEAASQLEVMSQAMSIDIHEYLPAEYSLDMFETEICEDFPLKLRLKILLDAVNKAADVFEKRSNDMLAMKDKLIDLVSEMWLEVGCLSENLKMLIRIPSVEFDDDHEYSKAYIQSRIAYQLTEKDISLVEENLSSWKSEIRSLSLKRSQLVARAITARDEAQSLISELEILNKTELKFLLPDATKEFSEDVIDNAIATVITKSASNPIGNEHILGGIEVINQNLKYYKCQRLSIVRCLSKVMTTCTWIENLDVEEVVVVNDSDFLISRRSLTEIIDKIDECFCSSFSILHHRIQQVKDLLAKSGNLVFLDDTVLDAINIDTILQIFLEKTCVHDNPGVIKDMNEKITWLHSFVTDGKTEPWIIDRIERIYLRWISEDGKNVTVKNVILKRLILVLQETSSYVQDIYRLDGQLIKHVQEIEEFESQSRQNRQRLLNGNSKALVEEEKIRKSSKRRYETLTEKMSQIITSLQHIGASHNIDGAVVEVSRLAHQLSPQGVDVLNGKMQEKIELMHLHSTTHGSKKSSADDSSIVETEKAQVVETLQRTVQQRPSTRPLASGGRVVQAKIVTSAIASTVLGESKLKPTKLPGPLSSASSAKGNLENIRSSCNSSATSNRTKPSAS